MAQKRMLDVGGVKFLKELSLKQRADIDEWQTQMQLKATQTSTVHLYTDGLTENEKRLTGVNVIDSVEEKLGDLILKKEDKSIAIIPEGPYLVPVYEPKI